MTATITNIKAKQEASSLSLSLSSPPRSNQESPHSRNGSHSQHQRYQNMKNHHHHHQQQRYDGHQRQQQQQQQQKLQELNNNDESSWNEFLTYMVDTLALFGDSSWAVGASFAMLVLALSVAVGINEDNNNAQQQQQQIINMKDPYQRLGPIPKISAPTIYTMKDNEASLITNEMRLNFEKDGVIAIRGLLSEELLNRLDIASNKLISVNADVTSSSKTNNIDSKKKKSNGSGGGGTQFHTVNISPALHNFNGTDNHSNESPFLQVALYSKIPTIIADLLQLSNQNNNINNNNNKNDDDVSGETTLRLMKDIFLVKDQVQTICGWHVDDTGFWPAIAESPGVNAWIALDDMPPIGGGGFALAVGSHKASWKEEAYYVTGSTHTYPQEGFQSAADMFANRTGSGTCNMKTAAPHLHRRMEETSRIYDVKRGDVIFHTRWLFHRTVAFENNYVASRRGDNDNENDNSELLYRRYSIRYGPGSSIIPRGYGTELSVLWDENNGGRSADDVSLLDGPWYPKAWPTVSQAELDQRQQLIQQKLPIAEQRRAERKAEMKPFLKQMGRKPRQYTKITFENQ